MRTVLTVIALVVWHACSSMAPPIVFAYASRPDAADVLCTCPDMPGAMCPMHHGGKGHQLPDDQDAGPRWCSGCPDLSQVVLSLMTTALAAPVGVYGLTPPEASQTVSPGSVSPITLTDPPRSPPPRR